MQINVPKEEFDRKPLGPLPKGEYLAVIGLASFHPPKEEAVDSPGSLKVPFTVAAENTPDGVARTVLRFFSFLPKCAWSLGILAKSAGIEHTEEADNVTFDSAALEGKKVYVRLDVEEWKGSPCNKVQAILPYRE